MFYHWATQPTDTLKKRQSTDPNQRPGLILASFTTGPWKKGQCSLYATSPTSVPYLQVETSTKKDILNEANCWYATINRSFRWFDRSTLNRSVDPCHCSTGRVNTYGCRAFSVAGPTVWNSLPDFIGDSTFRADWFRRLFKMYLITQYYCIQHIRGCWR